MKTRNLELYVGTFVLFGIISLLMLALQVSGLSDFYRKDQGYEVKAIFQNIGGLKIRSKITIGGVAIGRVVDIKLEENDGEYEPIVYMSINPNVNNIPRDSSAKILTAGLLGDNYIGIELGQEQIPLKSGDVISLTSQAVLLEELISKFAVGSNIK
jgi:phospholipid/cholesterol/gamma-HCH transport system substrate-binding protein